MLITIQIARGIQMSQLLRARVHKGAAQCSVGRAADTVGLLSAEGPCRPSHWSRIGLDGWLHSTERPVLCLQIPGTAEPRAVSCDPPPACSWHLGTPGKPQHCFCALIPYSGPLLEHLSWCIPWRPLWPQSSVQAQQHSDHT